MRGLGRAQYTARGLAKRRDIPWRLWLGCLAAAVLAHAALVIPGGHVLARSLGKGFEPRSSERAAFELELIEPEQPAEATLQFVPHNRSNEQRPAETTRIAERDSDVEQESDEPSIRPTPAAGRAGASKRAPEPSKRAPEPGEPTPPPTVSDPITPAVPNEELVAADDGQLSHTEPTPTPTPTEQWRLLAGSPSVLQDNFAAPLPATAISQPERPRQTALDSRAHVFAAFYARMHERILAHYDCEAAIARHDPQRMQLGQQQRTTVVRVLLDRSGAIERLSFLQESEVEYLDVEAIRTIRAAGPFPNPPAELFDEHGTLVIRVAFKVNPDGTAGVDRPSL